MDPSISDLPLTVGGAAEPIPIQIVGYEPPMFAFTPYEGNADFGYLARARSGRELRALFGREAREESVLMFTCARPVVTLAGTTLTRDEGLGVSYSNNQQVGGLDKPRSCEFARLHRPNDGGRHPSLDALWQRVLDRHTCGVEGCKEFLVPGCEMCSRHWSAMEDQRVSEVQRQIEEFDAAGIREAALLAERIGRVQHFPDAPLDKRRAVSPIISEGPPCVDCGSTKMRGVTNLAGFYRTLNRSVICDSCEREYGAARWRPEEPERRIQNPVRPVGQIERPSVIQRRAAAFERQRRRQVRAACTSALEVALKICDAQGDVGWIAPDQCDESICPGCGAPLKGPRHRVGGPRCSANYYERRIEGGSWVGPTVLGVNLHSDWMKVASTVWPDDRQDRVASEVRRSTRFGTDMRYAQVLESCIPGETAARTILEALRVDPIAGPDFREALLIRLGARAQVSQIAPEHRP